MMQRLCAPTVRVNAAAARVLAAALAPFGMTFDATFAWNVMPLVHTSAISTHGNKRYEWRLQEMLT